MALVKIAKTCSLCNQTHEEYDQSQMDDREKYLFYWNLPFEGEESDKAWQEKQTMTYREAPRVMSDISGYISQVDGSWIDSRSKHRNHLKQHGMIELGNDYMKENKPLEFTEKQNEARKRQIAEIAYEKLK